MALDRRDGREKLHQLLMLAASDPNMIIAGFAVGGLVLAALWRFIVWIREAPTTPDPWDAETEQKLSEPEAVEVCPRCFSEQPPTAWFCARCGSAVGPYNNLMPYVQIFSEGEVFRNGTSGRFRNRPLILIGYFLVTLGTYPLFAPIYWFSLLLNWKRPSGEPEPAEEQNGS
jgi:ribosomal protein L40E